MTALRSLLAAAGAAVLVLLASAHPAHGQVMVNRGINPWTGHPYRNVTMRNPWTGRVRNVSTFVDPWTGRASRNVQVFYPPMYNPWTGRPRWDGNRRRGWW
jgi:hypothetical protein